MIRKLLCWLGFHEWKRQEYTCTLSEMCTWREESGKIVCCNCEYNKFICKHCGKVKK